MKKTVAAAAMILAVLSLTACGRHHDAPPGSEIESSIPILLVESKPQQTTAPTEEPRKPSVPEETTTPETRPEARPIPKPTKPETGPEPTKPVAPTKPPAEPPKKIAPVLTKSPTDEVIKEGEKAWFIAHADHADGIRWWLSAPNGGGDLTPEKAMKELPGLKIQVLEADTVALSAVPMEMNAWSIRAEFYNSTGNTYSKKATIYVEDVPEGTTAPTVSPTTNDPMELYAPVFRDCLYIQTHDPRKTGDKDLEKYDPYQLAEGYELMSGERTLGYVLMDVDRDDTRELILGVAGENDFGENGGEIVYAMFTLKDRRPVKVFQSFERNRFYLAKNRLIYNEGSSGAANSVFNLFSLDGDRMTVEESLWSNGTDKNGNLKMFHSDDGTTKENKHTRILGEEFDRVLQDMSGKKLPLPTLTAVS